MIEKLIKRIRDGKIKADEYPLLKQLYKALHQLFHGED